MANANIVSVDVEQGQAGGGFNTGIRQNISKLAESLNNLNTILDQITHDAVKSGAVHDSLDEFFSIIKNDITGHFDQQANQLVVGWEMLAQHVNDANNK